MNEKVATTAQTFKQWVRERDWIQQRIQSMMTHPKTNWDATFAILMEYHHANKREDDPWVLLLALAESVEFFHRFPVFVPKLESESNQISFDPVNVYLSFVELFKIIGTQDLESSYSIRVIETDETRIWVLLNEDRGSCLKNSCWCIQPDLEHRWQRSEPSVFATAESVCQAEKQQLLAEDVGATAELPEHLEHYLLAADELEEKLSEFREDWFISVAVHGKKESLLVSVKTARIKEARRILPSILTVTDDQFFFQNIPVILQKTDVQLASPCLEKPAMAVSMKESK